MYDLEKRALMGDREAQLECTEKGIVLPCPCCSSEDISYRTSEGDYDYGLGGFRCWNCNLGQGYEFKTREEALANWNTRPAPPVPRCDECNSWCGTPGDDFIADCCLNECFMESNNYCRYFNPKED